MTANIIPFAFQDNLVRVVAQEEEPWFVGRDVCRVLDIKNESHALSRLDADERRDGVAITDPMGRVQTVVIVSEPGVFRLIFTSRKPEAEAFKRWLAHEVLPQLRRTGKFSVEEEPEALDDEPVPVLSLKLAMIREARHLFGAAKARNLWAQLGMPAMPATPEDVAAADALDADALACFRHLLTATMSPASVEDRETAKILRSMFDAPASIVQLCDLAFAGEERAVDALLTFDLRVETHGEHGDALWVPNISDALSIVYEGTAWADGGWRYALRRLPRAQFGRSARVYRVRGVPTRGTLMPEAAIAEAMAVAARAHA